MSVNQDSRVARLPKWAQDHIRGLERERDLAVRELRQSESQQPTRTSQGFNHRPNSVGEPARWLPDEHVTFYLSDPRRERDTFVQVRHEEWRGSAWVQIMGSESPLVIEPAASNVVRVKVGKR